jgi:uncharacterized membrane protein YkvA (DUF1232 family)
VEGPLSLDEIVVLTITLMIMVVVGTIGVSAFVVARHRVPFKGILALGAAIVYALSPVDLLPEAGLGPVGLVDDIGFFMAAVSYAKRLGAIRRAVSRYR